jgi:hypothetical protein
MDQAETQWNLSQELLKALHLLTRDGQLNQDARRKLNQIHHLLQFLEPLLKEAPSGSAIIDVGSGKSYLGLILRETLLKDPSSLHLIGLETRQELNDKAEEIAKLRKLDRCEFKTVSCRDFGIPDRPVGMIVALHACDAATDEALVLGLQNKARHLALIPCCQAELATELSAQQLKDPLRELFRFPLHRRNFGAHVTNVMRMLYLESQGYKVRVTEFTGFEHTQKNELILATKHQKSNAQARRAYETLVESVGVELRVLKEHNSLLKQAVSRP